MPFCYNYQTIIKNFYINNQINLAECFNYINEDRIKILKEKAHILNKTYISPKLTKVEKYCKRIERIETAPKIENDFNKISTNNSLEKLLLFVFSVDPNFEAFYIYSTCNTMKEIQYEMNNTFGLFDPYLIKIEKQIIKFLLNEEEKENINKEIEKRVFK